MAIYHGMHHLNHFLNEFQILNSLGVVYQRNIGINTKSKLVHKVYHFSRICKTFHFSVQFYQISISHSSLLSTNTTITTNTSTATSVSITNSTSLNSVDGNSIGFRDIIGSSSNSSGSSSSGTTNLNKNPPVKFYVQFCKLSKIKLGDIVYDNNKNLFPSHFSSK
ncbi:hypothetical protein DDB_G0291017 [Dictyostelium discoideum AX4]|uniref:Uncharacterized protein n=1 Tax=Dictyostelium discoideum TaxID=44689 RepID=Q54F83_DICDI|nr:hypothetical protein DDB_G0291017 [Dictyostelium discoideum AX4]EAL61939.1 hypothetical protein DDB_G0291017 [Dictyostelium discoideum AX4]|eukprot:XP_635454.1 hypothetical protein DDB_G0291017 [Dictyostelium discoideum AX4]